MTLLALGHALITIAHGIAYWTAISVVVGLGWAAFSRGFRNSSE